MFFSTPYDGGLFGAPTRTPGVEVHANADRLSY